MRRLPKLPLGLVTALGVLLLALGWWLLRAPNPRAPEPGSQEASSGEELLECADLLVSTEVTVRQAAEQTLRRFLLTNHAVEQGPLPRPTRLTAENWFRREGGAALLPALLERFRLGLDEHAAAELLELTMRRFPKACQELSSEPLLDPEPQKIFGVETLVGPLHETRLIVGGRPASDYLLFRREQVDQPVGAALARGYLRRLARTPSGPTHDRLIRLLRRVPDRELRTLLRQHAEQHSWSDFPALLEDRAGPSNSYSSIRDWCDRPDSSDWARSLSQVLRASDPIRVADALDRLRWDPQPGVDAEVIWLAQHGPSPELKRAAIGALRAVPTSAGNEALRSALDDPERRDAAIRVLRSRLANRGGLFQERWDPFQLPVEHMSQLAAWRDAAEHLSAGADLVETVLTAKKWAPDLIAERLALVPLLELRRQLGPGWYDARTGPQLVAYAEHADPAVRFQAIRALTPWERGNTRVLPFLIQRLTREDSPRVQEALLDAVVVIGGSAAYPELIQLLGDSGSQRKFHGLALVETYELLFPKVNLVSPILRLTSGSTAQRTMAAYLLGGVPTTRKTGATLVELLRDRDETVRFWAQQSLRRHYDSSHGYDPRRRPEENAPAIEEWRRVVERHTT